MPDVVDIIQKRSRNFTSINLKAPVLHTLVCWCVADPTNRLHSRKIIRNKAFVFPVLLLQQKQKAKTPLFRTSYGHHTHAYIYICGVML